MPRLDGIGRCGGCASGPAARVIVLSSFVDDERLFPRCAPAPPATCSRTSSRPSSCGDPHRARRRVAALARGRGAVEALASGGGPRRRRPADAARARGAVLIARGQLEQADRARAGAAEKTVKTHVRTSWPSSALTDRTQAALYAVREGWSARGPRPNYRWLLSRRAPSLIGMPTAIVTGASRGLGLALLAGPRRLAGGSSSTPARPSRSRPPPRPSSPRPPPSPATCRPEPPAHARPGRGRRGSTCSSTTPRCSGRARSPRSPTTRSTCSSRSTAST